MILNKKNIFVFLFIGIFIGNTLTFSFSKFIPGNVIICNYSEYDIHELRSRFFYLNNIPKGKCEKVVKERMIFTDFDLKIYSQRGNKGYEFNWFPYYPDSKTPIIFTTKKIIINELYIDEKMQKLETRGKINFIIE